MVPATVVLSEPFVQMLSGHNIKWIYVRLSDAINELSESAHPTTSTADDCTHHGFSI
jgi:hypothetical protein